MKTYLRKILEWVLKQLARATIWRYRPGIVGVTGSVGKTSAKIAIAAVLSADRTVRASPDSHNNQIGLPLTILGEWSESDLRLVSKNTPGGVNNAAKGFFWIKVVVLSFWRIVKKIEYSEILVLEYGADRPGDIKYLLSIARPNFGVITAIGETPVHVEFYAGPEDVAREKVRLIESLSSAAAAGLNFDDPVVMSLKDRTRAHMLTFGFGTKADVRIFGFENRIENGRPAGIDFKLEYGGVSVPVRLDACFGRTQAYAAAAAACMGIAYGMNLVRISEALRAYRPASGRTELLPGIKESLVIDDSFNASPLSMAAALATLKDLPAKRKIAVLGDMLELGPHTIPAHERVGELVAESANLLFAVGPRAKFIAASAEKHGMRKQNIRAYTRVEELMRDIPELVKKGDLILVKGSHAMRLDEAVETLHDTLEKTPELV